MPFLPYIPFEQSFLDHRDDPNLLILHYADLKRDLVGSMTRIAGFLGVQLSQYELTDRAEHATFEAMRRDGAKIIPGVAKNFEGGADTLFRCARKSGWRGYFREPDISFFEAELASAFCATDLRFLLDGEIHDTDNVYK
jgi:aryl sulfotransferase